MRKKRNLFFGTEKNRSFFLLPILGKTATSTQKVIKVSYHQCPSNLLFFHFYPFYALLYQQGSLAVTPQRIIIFVLRNAVTGFSVINFKKKGENKLLVLSCNDYKKSVLWRKQVFFLCQNKFQSWNGRALMLIAPPLKQPPN